jgi:Protein of unknown function (DUF3048) N-terminal domain/Protein of unknown function (DUF3048) C-terminal domain
MNGNRLRCLVAISLAVLLAACSSDSSGPQEEKKPASAQETKKAPPVPSVCPLSGQKPSDDKLVARPAVAVKVENNPAAYPLSGLDHAEIVYEELVEGGLTRFMALYHCTDATTVGPVRSTRVVDPAIMTPATKILAGAGGNAIVRKALKKHDIVLIDELKAGNAMRRIARPGVSSEHTLYGDTKRLRKIGAKHYDKPPPGALHFGSLPAGAKPASHVAINFGGSSTITYDYKDGKWLRSDDGEPLVMENGKQIAVDNVVIERHTINFSKKIVDVAGNPSTEIADVTGKGKALLFRNGKVITGTWERDSIEGEVTFKTSKGDDMTLHPGTTWIELAPTKKGEIKGDVTYTGKPSKSHS